VCSSWHEHFYPHPTPTPPQMTQMHILFLCAPYNPCVCKLTWTLLVTPTPPQMTHMHILLRVSTCVQVAFSVGLSFSRFWFGGSVPPSQFHRAPCASCKFAAFTGVHAFSVSTQLTLRNLTVRHILSLFSAIPLCSTFIFIIHKSQTRTLRLTL